MSRWKSLFVCWCDILTPCLTDSDTFLSRERKQRDVKSKCKIQGQWAKIQNTNIQKFKNQQQHVHFLPIVPISAFPAIVQLYKVWAEVANSDKLIISWYLRSSSRLKSVTQIVVLSVIPSFPLSTHYLPLSRTFVSNY